MELDQVASAPIWPELAQFGAAAEPGARSRWPRCNALGRRVLHYGDFGAQGYVEQSSILIVRPSGREIEHDAGA
jgi:hypothetical protein